MTTPAGDWLDAPDDVRDRINIAMREVYDAYDDATRLPTWDHLIGSLVKLREATNRALAVCVIPSDKGDA